MPRGKQKRTATGAVAQQVKSVPGQRYGEGVDQQAMQRQMPAADLQATNAAMLRSAGAPSAAALPPTAGMPPGQPPTGADLAALMQQIPAGLLTGTQRPREPITAGLSQGPGPGPEMLGALRTVTPMRRMLEQLSNRSGDPYFRELADRARL